MFGCVDELHEGMPVSPLGNDFHPVIVGIVNEVDTHLLIFVADGNPSSHGGHGPLQSHPQTSAR